MIMSSPLLPLSTPDSLTSHHCNIESCLMMDKIELNGQFWKVNNVALVFYERLLDWKKVPRNRRDERWHSAWNLFGHEMKKFQLNFHIFFHLSLCLFLRFSWVWEIEFMHNWLCKWTNWERIKMQIELIFFLARSHHS